MKKTLLIIFTFKYPFEPPTEQFLDDELRFLAEKDADILLVPSAREKKNVLYAFPGTRDNISVCEIRRSCLPCETFSGLLSAAGHIGYLRDDIRRIRRESNLQNKTHAVKETLKEYVQAGALCRDFVRQIPDSVFRGRERIVLYSYWLNPAAAAEALFKKYLKKKYHVPVSAFARAHGDGDLYRKDTGHCRPCRKLLNEELDMVFPISRNGRESLMLDGITKAETRRLGVKKMSPFLPAGNSVPLVISCSVVNGNKRVEKIADILSRFRQEVRWVHFGGGPQEQNLRAHCEKVLPGNVRWELRGWTDHDAILDFYRKETPGLLLNVSRMEGIPVSIMEAMSCSIPCAATDVGASGEIVADGRNGFLLPVEFDVEETARRIGGYLFGDEETRARMRKNAYATFEREYDAAANYAAFAGRIISGGADVPRKQAQEEPFSQITQNETKQIFQSRPHRRQTTVNYYTIDIKTIRTEKEGMLSFFEGTRDFPFEIKRIYYIHHVPAEARRGAHAHKTLRQMIFCPYGSVTIFLNDGETEEQILLDNPGIGIVLMPGLWRDMQWNIDNSVLCVAASDYYDANDYIRDYDEYLAYLKTLKKETEK